MSEVCVFSRYHFVRYVLHVFKFNLFNRFGRSAPKRKLNYFNFCEISFSHRVILEARQQHLHRFLKQVNSQVPVQSFKLKDIICSPCPC